MKKQILNKIPALKNHDGVLSGGFSALSIMQSKKIKGGANRSGCTNNCSVNTMNCNGDRNNNLCQIIN